MQDKPIFKITNNNLKFEDIKNGRIYAEDCIKAMQEIQDGVVDMLLVDLPYGTTACSWDTVIPFDKLWEQYNRVCKKNAAMVFTAAQPFTTALIASNIANFRYDWVWIKNSVTNFGNAKRMPLRNCESVVVFYRSPCVYNPQGLVYAPKTVKNGESVGGQTMRGDIKKSANKGALRTPGHEYVQEYTNYPRQTLAINQNSRNKIHPTQKPVELFEYLIKTYTNEGDVVLDNAAGSGTTAIAAEKTNRRWICVEKNEEYASMLINRLVAHGTQKSE